MTPLGRKAVSASIQLPIGFETKSNLLDYLQNAKLPLWQPISPQCTTELSVAQTIVLRGIPENMLYSKLVLPVTYITWISFIYVKNISVKH